MEMLVESETGEMRCSLPSGDSRVAIAGRKIKKQTIRFRGRGAGARKPVANRPPRRAAEEQTDAVARRLSSTAAPAAEGLPRGARKPSTWRHLERSEPAPGRCTAAVEAART